MNQSPSIKELATALAQAQSEFTAVPFNSTNPFLKNKYADLGSVIETAKPVLAKHGLSVSQLVYDMPGCIGVTTILMHSSGEYVSSSVSLPLGEEKGKSQAQVAGSVITYLRRYALSSILGLYADEDTDGNQPEVKRPASSRTLPAPETLAQAKARLMQAVIGAYPDIYPDQTAISFVLKTHQPPFTFDSPAKYAEALAILTAAADARRFNQTSEIA